MKKAMKGKKLMKKEEEEKKKIKKLAMEMTQRKHKFRSYGGKGVEKEEKRAPSAEKRRAAE